MSKNQFHEYLLKLKEYDRKSKYRNSIGITINELKKRWRDYANEFKFRYKELDVNFDESKNIQIKLNENIIFIVDTIEDNDEKIIKSITMIGSGDGSPESGMNIFISIGIQIACINPDEDVDFRNKMMKQLGLFEEEIEKNKIIINNDLKYHIRQTQQVGVWFTVSRNEKDES